MLPNVARAQVPWETPQLLSPHAPCGVSLVATSFAAAPGDGRGASVLWRLSEAPGVGLRVTGGEGRGGQNAAGGGVEVSGWITRAHATFPLDLVWTTGIGASYGRFVQIALPMGISAGRSIGDDGPVWFNLYAAARMIVEGRVGGRAPDDELDLQLATELGANLAFDRNRTLALRMSAAVGGRSALAIGANIGAGRKRIISTAASTH